MMNAVKNYKVTIFDDQYVLASDESEEIVVQTAALVDMMMKEIAKNSKVSDTRKIAVLASLQIASKLTKLKLESEAIKQHEEKLIDRIDQELFSI